VKEVRASSHYYYSQRLRLHYLDWGNVQARPMLLVHGVQDHAHTWDFLAQHFLEHYHVVVPDLRGHGDSDWNRGSAYRHSDYVYDLVRLIEQRRLGGCVVVAHSMGATLAALLAGAFPELVHRLVLLEGVGLWPGWFTGMSADAKLRAWEKQMHGLADRSPRRYPTLEAACLRMQQVNPQLSAAIARHLTVHGSHQNEDGSYSWKFDNYTHSPSLYSIPEVDTIALWQRVACPTLILNAMQGYPHRIGHDGTDCHFRDLVLQDVDGAGHWLHHDRLPVIADHIRTFLSR
jgi:pimeloyl-ACP methyl ester carboxylesterase